MVSVTEFKIDKNDLVTIAISEAEGKINLNVKDLTAQVKELDGKITKTKDAIANDDAKSAKASGIAMLVDNVIDAAAKVGTKLKAGKMEFQASGDDITVVMNVIRPDGNYNSTNDSPRTTRTLFSATVKAKVSAESKALSLELVELEKSRVAVFAELVDWKKKATQIPQLERQFRARLVKAELEKTADGMALLESLAAGTIDQALLQLS